MNTEEQIPLAPFYKGGMEHVDAIRNLSSIKEVNVADRWIRSRLHHCIAEFSGQLDAYRFDLAAQALYDFFWNEYCDWYMELCKPVLNQARNVPA